MGRNYNKKKLREQNQGQLPSVSCFSLKGLRQLIFLAVKCFCEQFFEFQYVGIISLVFAYYRTVNEVHIKGL